MKYFTILAVLFLSAYSYSTFADEVVLVEDCVIIQSLPGFSPDPDQDGVPTFCYDKLESEETGYERESEEPYDTCSNVYNPNQITPLDRYDNNCNGVHDGEDWTMYRVWHVELLGNYVGDYNGDGRITTREPIYGPHSDLCTMQLSAYSAGVFQTGYQVAASCIN